MYCTYCRIKGSEAVYLTFVIPTSHGSGAARTQLMGNIKDGAREDQTDTRKKGLDEGERGLGLELQSDPGSETLQREVGTVGVGLGLSSLERCANYNNRKTRLRLWEVILRNVPSDRMTTMLLNVISAESEFERSLVDKFCGGHSAELFR